jgi:hypothetical protein
MMAIHRRALLPMPVVEIEKKAVVIVLQSRHRWPSSSTTNKGARESRTRECIFLKQESKINIETYGQDYSEVIVLWEKTPETVTGSFRRFFFPT